jgi:hypothetical protein
MLMGALVLFLMAAQAPCPPDAQQLVWTAAARAQEPDLSASADLLRDAASRGCADADVGSLYLRGLIEAKDAFRQGAPPESLVSVYKAIASLEEMARGQPGPAEIARLMLRAAAAAAQSERDEMALYLEHAERMDGLLRASGQPAAPILSAAEISGELWLQVHRYEDAHAAFTKAASQVGMTPRVVAGLARASAAR